jgi:hypothetical protein
MVRSEQSSNGLFAAVQVTVCPGPGTGGWLQAAWAELAIHNAAMAKLSKIRNCRGSALACTML